MNEKLWHFVARNKESPVNYDCKFRVSHEQALELLYESNNDFAVIVRAGEDDLLTVQVTYKSLYQKWLDVTECENAKKIHDPK